MFERIKAIFGGKRSEDLAAAGASMPQIRVAPLDRNKLKEATEAQIDAFMKKVGIPDPVNMTDEEGWRFFQLGSARGRAGVIESEEELYLQVEAPVMPLPSDNDLILPLMRELLELNLTIPLGGKIGISNETVVVAVIRLIKELLHEDDVAQSIHSVMSIADGIDDNLIKKYGGTTKKRKPLEDKVQKGDVSKPKGKRSTR